MLGYTFLPDHIHLLNRPTGQSNFSSIVHSLKRNFTKQYKENLGIHGSLQFWQPRFWDHLIRDEEDFQRHLDYIHYDAVKHGLVSRPEDWPDSSFAEWKRRCVYANGKGWSSLPETLQAYAWGEAE
jgi:putative transposase